MKLKVEIDNDEITIFDEQGLEIVHWIQDEWVEDPKLVVPAIANAVRMAYEEPEKLLEMNKKHIESQKEFKKVLKESGFLSDDDAEFIASKV